MFAVVSTVNLIVHLVCMSATIESTMFLKLLNMFEFRQKSHFMICNITLYHFRAAKEDH